MWWWYFLSFNRKDITRWCAYTATISLLMRCFPLFNDIFAKLVSFTFLSFTKNRFQHATHLQSCSGCIRVSSTMLIYTHMCHYYMHDVVCVVVINECVNQQDCWFKVASSILSSDYTCPISLRDRDDRSIHARHMMLLRAQPNNCIHNSTQLGQSQLWYVGIEPATSTYFAGLYAYV